MNNCWIKRAWQSRAALISLKLIFKEKCLTHKIHTAICISNQLLRTHLLEFLRMKQNLRSSLMMVLTIDQAPNLITRICMKLLFYLLEQDFQRTLTALKSTSIKLFIKQQQGLYLVLSQFLLSRSLNFPPSNRQQKKSRFLCTRRFQQLWRRLPEFSNRRQQKK